MKFWKSALLYAATVCTLTATSCSDETKEPKLYTTAVTDDGNGTAEAVTLTATPAENFFFLKWTVLSGGIELENPTENPTTFTLPEGGGISKSEPNSPICFRLQPPKSSRMTQRKRPR